MLPKANRLVKEHDFTLIFKKGQYFCGQFLGWRFLPNQLPCSRFGFVISNKISKKATVRNKIKRQLREIVRLNLKQIKKGFNVVIIVRPKILELNFLAIAAEVLNGLKQIKLINDERNHFKIN